MLDPEILKDLNNKTAEEGRNSEGKESRVGGRREGDKPRIRLLQFILFFCHFLADDLG